MLPVKLTTIKEVSQALTHLIEEKPRDLAITILSTNVISDLKSWATEHLINNCVDCEVYIASKGDLAVRKIVSNRAVYDDEELSKLEAKAKVISDKIKARKQVLTPTHYVQSSPYFKSTKA